MPQRKAQPHIPVEVVEAVIDHFQKDKKTLKVCSRVAREWLPRSRYHLLGTIRVLPGNYRGLLSILNSPRSYFTVYVRSIGIVNPGNKDTSWVNDVMPALAKHFGSITEIVLGGLSWRQLTEQSTKYLCTAFRKSKSIMLLDCYFVRFSDIARLACSSDLAESIHIVLCKVDSTGGYPSPDLTISPNLRQVNIDTSPPSFVTWLSSQKPLRLEKLTVDAVTPTNITGMKSIISHSGSSLKYLRFGLDDDFLQLETQPHLDLSQNTYLEVFHLTLAFPNPFSIYVGLASTINLSFLVPLFSSIFSSSLQELTLRISVGSPDDLKVIDWHAIDKLASERPWGRSLKRLHVELTEMVPGNEPQDFMEEAELIIYRGLNDIAKRGRLNVKYRPMRRQNLFM
ncbi:hypothetical protein CPC08DRAFT_747314 [Agrocybe pediades]|nr:hypothetical protein CPC08DRAFT_747314 [Agrocybe pediades]